MMNRKVGFGLLGAAVVAAPAWFLFFRPDPLASAGKRLVGCVLSGNAACVLSYATTEEVAAMGANEAGVRVLLDSYIRPAYDRHRRTAFVTEYLPGTGQMMVRQDMVSGGEIEGFGVVVCDTTEGIRSPGILTDLLLKAATLRYATDPIDGKKKLEAWAKSAELNADEWRQLGFKGIFRDEREGLVPWEEWAKGCRERLAKAESYRRQAPRPSEGEGLG